MTELDPFSEVKTKVWKSVIGKAEVADGCRCFSNLIMGLPNTYFFFKCFKKKLLNIFLNFFFYFKVQSFRLIMANNFIQMAASAGHAVAYTIGPIFKHIIDCVQLYCKRQLSLTCRLPTNNSPTVSNRSSEVAKRH